MRLSNEELREKFHNLAVQDDAESDWEPVISIGTAAGMVSLSPSALRKYEHEGLLIFHRTKTGRRLLSMADLKRIRMIQRMIKVVGLNMEGIRRLLALLPCWEIRGCDLECARRGNDNCVARTHASRPCWMLDETECSRSKDVDCRECKVYRYGAYCTDVMKDLLH